MGQEKDAAEYIVPLRYPNPLTSTATYGQLNITARHTIHPPTGSDPKRGGLTVNVSPSLAGQLGPSFDYLRKYPYACLEQKASRALGDLLSLTWAKRLGRSKLEIEATKERIERLSYAAGQIRALMG